MPTASNPKPHALIYARFSVKGETSVSVRNQIAQNLAEAQRLGYTVDPKTDLFRDDQGHQSGLDSKRPAYLQLKRAAETRPDVAAIIFRDTTRLTRDTIEWEWWRAFVRRKNISLISIQDPLPADTAEGDMIMGIRAHIARYQPRRVSEQMKRHVAFVQSQGAHWGAPPLGLITTGKGTDRHLIPGNETYLAPDGKPRAYLDTVIAFLKLYTEHDIGVPRSALTLSAQGYRWKSSKGEPIPVESWHLEVLLRTLHSYRDHIESRLLARAADTDTARTYGSLYSGNRINKEIFLRPNGTDCRVSRHQPS